MAKNSFIIVEILQNGETVATTAKPLGRRGRISIGSSQLKVPFYAFSEPLEVIKISRKGAELCLDGEWEGFIKSREKFTDVKSHRSTSRSIPIKNGDYGSLYWHDLQLLFRIGKLRTTSVQKAKLDPAYRGQFFSLFLQTNSEKKVLAAAFAAVLVVFFSSVYTINHLHLKTNTAFSELDPKYIAPFFHPLHLKTIPEALQDKFDRSNYYKSTQNYYSSLTDMVLGWGDLGSAVMYKSSVNLYQKLHDNREERLDARIKSQRETEARALSLPKSSMVAIPSVKGESAAGGALKLLDKIALIHKSFELNLKYRREMRDIFENDPLYEFGNYKKLKQSKKASDALAAIQPFHILTNEETMYAIADELAKKSARAQYTINKRRADRGFLKPSAHKPLGIPAGVSFASFLNEMSLLSQDDKIDQLEASVLGSGATFIQSPETPGKAIKEPLIGMIEPTLIERTIQKNKYELQLCYELALRRNQHTDGRMEWSWRIDSRGKITQLELVSTNIRDRNMVRCIRQKIASWNFPRPRRGSVEVSYPFLFSKVRG